MTLRLSHYFEQNSVHCPCPVLAVNGFQTFVRRKEFLLFVILISFILLYATNISIWINESIHGHGEYKFIRLMCVYLQRVGFHCNSAESF